MLGAALFFSRANERIDLNKLFTSFSCQIVIKFPSYSSILDRNIFNDPSLLKKSRAQRFQEFFVKPLQEHAARGEGVEKRLVIIDGFD